MTKEEKTITTDCMEVFYAQYLSVAKELVTIKVEEYGAILIITPKDMLKIIHHSVALGLAVSRTDFTIDDKELASDMVTEYYNIYADQVSQYIPITKNETDE